MMTFREGSYYVIEFSSIHNNDLEYKVVTCDSPSQIEGKIKEQMDLHEKNHWPGENLAYKVWHIAVAKVPVKEIRHEFRIVVGEE